MVWGLNPGPLLFVEHKDFVWGLIASMYLGNVVGLVIVLTTVPIFAAILRVPFAAVAPMIVVSCAIGAYAIQNAMFDVWLMLLFGVVGYVFKKIGIPLAPFTLALVLGNRTEDAFRLSMIGAGGDMRVFWSNGLVGSITTLAFILLFWPLIGRILEGAGRLRVRPGPDARGTASLDRRRPPTRSTWTDMTMSDPIAVARGPIATVTLNRPEKLNALTKAMWQQLGDAIGALSADDALRCVIVRGAGEKAFSPGNDIGEFAVARANKAQAIEYGRVMHATAKSLAECRHPLVAQIHGICVGGGLEIAALCDLRICGESSRFGAPIKNLGLVMAYAEMAPLVRLAGPDVALEILLEGRIFDAAEAKEKRLVTRVVADGEVAAEAQATAQRIAEGAPLVARWHKRFARRLADPRADLGSRARRVLRLFRHRRLSHRLRRVSREAQAGVHRAVT